MKFTCTQENLVHGLTSVSRVASKSAVLAILNNVLIISENGHVQLQTTNLELAIIVSIRAKIETPGRYTVPSRLLTEFISLLGNERVTIETTAAGLRVTSGHTQTTIKGTPAEDFPVLPTHDAPTETTIPANTLRQALEGVIFAAANDESRPEISGTLLTLNGNRCTMAATDSYRLAEHRATTLTAVSGEKRAIIPSRTAQELLRLTPDTETVITIKLGDDQARFLLPDTEIISRVIEGQYPDYQQIIPTGWQTKAACDRNELIANVRAASLFCKSGINDLALTIDPAKKTIRLSAANTQLGEHQASVPAEIDGQETSIVFNYRYLLDGLQSLGGHTAWLEFQDHNAPGVLRNPDRTDALYLLMPIRQ
ncbi:MAG: DNA polymerase III subunit beta [Patescibacteria group bacterium]